MAEGPIRFKNRLDLSQLRGVQKVLAELGRGLTKDEAQQIGDLAVSAMKGMISQGLSPIRGGDDATTRLRSYLDPKKYPGKRKPRTPVNLFLTGKMLADLKAVPVQGSKGWLAEIGYRSEKEQLKEKGHRIGSDKARTKKRPTIPIFSRGERFAKRVEDTYLAVVFDIYDKLTKKR